MRKFGKSIPLWLNCFWKKSLEMFFPVVTLSREFYPCAVQLNSHANKSQTMCCAHVQAQSFNKRIPFIGIETVPNW